MVAVEIQPGVMGRVPWTYLEALGTFQRGVA